MNDDRISELTDRCDQLAARNAALVARNAVLVGKLRALRNVLADAVEWEERDAGAFVCGNAHHGCPARVENPGELCRYCQAD